MLGSFEPSDYVAEHLWVEARDGTRVPVSLVHRKGLKRNGRAPLFLYGYGAYGYSSDPRFSSPLLSLLDRGFVYAIAHVRGGQEMGRAWYEDGRLLRKQNSFNDFVDVTRALVETDYAAADKVFAMGASAGGLLMAAAVNQCPGCYRGLLVLVPFVDVVTTMLDPGIPLTANEFDEWGNPTRKADYDYLLSYSPYDNIERKDYPAMLVATGLWDSRCSTTSRPSGWRGCARARPTSSRCCSGSAWMPAMAASPGASRRIARPRSITPSCSTGSASPRTSPPRGVADGARRGPRASSTGSRDRRAAGVAAGRLRHEGRPRVA